MASTLPIGFNDEGSFQAYDGLSLHYFQHQLDKPRYQLLALHGIGEHAGRYGWMASNIAADRGSFSCLDLRGHGLSDGQRGHSPSYQQLLDDIDCFIQNLRLAEEVPLFMFGHSLSGALVLNYALQCNHHLKGVIASAPLLRLSFQPPRWKLYLARKLVKALPRFSLNRDIEPSVLTRDEAMRTAYKIDPLIHEKASAALTVGFLDAGEFALSNANQLRTPTLVMHGEADQVTSIEASREFVDRAGTVATFKSFEHCYHELINEPERDQVAKAIQDWIQIQLTH